MGRHARDSGPSTHMHVHMAGPEALCRACSEAVLYCILHGHSTTARKEGAGRRGGAACGRTRDDCDLGGVAVSEAYDLDLQWWGEQQAASSEQRGVRTGRESAMVGGAGCMLRQQGERLVACCIGVSGLLAHGDGACTVHMHACVRMGVLCVRACMCACRGGTMAHALVDASTIANLPSQPKPAARFVCCPLGLPPVQACPCTMAQLSRPLAACTPWSWLPPTQEPRPLAPRSPPPPPPPPPEPSSCQVRLTSGKPSRKVRWGCARSSPSSASVTTVSGVLISFFAGGVAAAIAMAAELDALWPATRRTPTAAVGIDRAWSTQGSAAACS